MIDRTEVIVLAALILISFGVAHKVYSQINALADYRLEEMR